MNRLIKYTLTLTGIFVCFISNSQISVTNYLEKEIPFSYTGKVVDAFAYNDKSGSCFLLITKESSIDSVKIRAAGYKKVSGKYVRQWEIRDQATEIAHHFPYTRIVDLDKDGVAETIFTYQLNPDHGDGSDWKVMLHHNSRKYALRVHVPGLDYDKYIVAFDKSYKNIPSQMKKYVQDYWKAIVKENGLKTK